MIYLWAALSDLYIQALCFIKAFGERLIETAVLCLRPPVGAKAHSDRGVCGGLKNIVAAMETPYITYCIRIFVRLAGAIVKIISLLAYPLA